VIKTEQNPTHTWSNSGTYSATLRVQDSAGLWSEPKVGRVFISDSLIAKYAPVVYLHKDEKFYPTVIEALLTYSDLKTKDETIVGPITVDQLMAHNDEDTYLDLILINRAGILSENAPDPNYFTLYPLNIYARKKTDGGRTALQYWFFYTYNQGKLNAHEGDWEMFQILLDSDENPDRVTYSWHVPFSYTSKGLCKQRQSRK
jgi:PKD repeat protein